MIPAPAQGAIAVVSRKSDKEIIQVLSKINHSETLSAVNAEREFLRMIEAGCSNPVGAYAVVSKGKIFLKAEVLSPGGKEKIIVELSDKLGNAKRLGQRAARVALKKGAKNLLT